MASLLIYSIPEVLYALVVRWKEKASVHRIAGRLGLTLADRRFYLWALGFTAVGIALSWGTLRLLPRSILENEAIATSPFIGQALGLTLLLSALIYGFFQTGLGEELFFRGLIAGWLGRRTSFWVANVLQAAIFTLPHLLLLTVDVALWPLAFAFPFVSGLMLGWLRLKSGSILPGWLMHGLVNLFSAILVMQL